MPTRLSVRKPADFIEFRSESILQGIHQRIEQQVALYPDKDAIATERTVYTYSEMNGLANSLANAILSAIGESLDNVAILEANSPALIISILASLKARKAYVPLDCNFPIERLRAMMSDSQAKLILTDQKHLPLAEELRVNNARIINVESIPRSADVPNVGLHCEPMDRAYILYTSGTTGKPKGIEFLHRNLLHTTMCLTNELFYSPSDRVSWLHSPSFGSSIVDIYNCLTNGGTLFPWDTKTQGFTGMAEWIANRKLTALHWVPSAFRQFMRTVPAAFTFNDIRIIVMAGETLTTREVELFRRHCLPGSHLINQVGTAESYNYYLYRVDHEIPLEHSNVPGGYPVSPDRELHILDDSHADVPQGVIGEIAIKSRYMAAGYWGNDELTKAKFIRRDEDNIPMYLTGDLGMVDNTGCLIHLGRKDFQLKIRGCRVELSEIDGLLSSAPGVADATTWVVKNHRGEDELVGYIVAKDGGEINTRRIEEYLRIQLPAYMVPRHYLALDSIPMLPTGKTDRNSLPNPFVQGQIPEISAASDADAISGNILEVFKELLQVPNVSLDSDFLDEGGDSLLSAVLIHRLHQEFEVDLSPEDLTGELTPRRLAALVRNGGGNGNGYHLQRSVRSESLSKASFGKFPSSGSCAPDSLPHQNLIIIGAGQCGREVFAWASQAIAAGAKLRIKGFLDERSSALSGYNYDVGVLGTVDEYDIERGDVFIGAIGNPVTKEFCYSKILEKGGRFVSIIHPLANIGKNAEIGNGVVIAPFSSITVDAKIGNHVSIGTLSNIAHDTNIGDWCQISSHCGVNGLATLGEGAFLGSHVCIIPKVNVGSWSYIGAGSVVIKDVPAYAKMFGNPATIIGKAEHPRTAQRPSLEGRYV